MHQVYRHANKVQNFLTWRHDYARIPEEQGKACSVRDDSQPEVHQS